MPPKRYKRTYTQMSARAYKRPARAFQYARRYQKSKRGYMAEGLKWMAVPSYAFGPSQSRTFPSKLVTKLVYNESSYMTFDNSTIAQPVYRLNSAYDIVAAVGGSQPYYFDTLCGANGTNAPYARYRVLYSTVTVEFINISNASTGMNVGVGFGLNTNGVNSDAAGLQLLQQRPGYRHAPIGPSSGGTNKQSWRVFVSHRDLLGVKDMKDAADQVGDYNGNPPGAEVNLMLVAAPLDWSDSTSRQVYYRLRVEQTIEFLDLNVVQES